MISETPFTPPKLQKRTLKGHSKAVLCIAHSSERIAYIPKPNHTENNGVTHPSLLLSGSEDGTARLWDLRTRTTAYCMVVPKSKEGEILEVASVAFHPSIYDNDTCKEGQAAGEPNDLVLNGSSDCTVYVGASNHVYGYDLRYHSKESISTTSSEKQAKPNPIIRYPHFNLSNHFECTDEINQFSFSYPKRNNTSKDYFMSAACDSGDVHVCQNVPFQYTEQSSKEQNPKLMHHANSESQAITSCSLFRPRVNDVYLVSSGTDCTVKLWDVKKPRRALYTVNIKPQEETQNSSQLCNPPFVHSLSWSPSGRYLAAGLGDGSCLILSAEGRKLVEASRLGWDLGGHKAPVAVVCFPCFSLACDASKKAMMHGTVDDRLMISAGNEGNIIFWDLGRDLVGCDAANPSSYLTRRDENTEVGDLPSRLDSMSIASSVIPDDLLPSPPKVLFQIPHQHKTNWICPKRADATSPCSLFVADTTNCISLYSLNL